jgi:Alpha-glutamyl/putrescinyl thymine pyrophosphorylase clade 3
MPTFCRHNRFIERCTICSKTLPGDSPGGRAPGGAPRRKAATGARTSARRGANVRVHRQQRAAEDGYGSALLPGLHASADAARLAEEIAFSSGRLLVLQGSRPDLQPPDLYDQVRVLVPSDLEQATWACFLIAYLCPLEGPEPFAGIRQALQVERGALEDLSEVALGPRSSYDPTRRARTLDAYRQWVAQSGSQALAFSGDASWSAQRRFERLFERIALPGLTRAARYELLVLLGALGAYELQADSLHFSARASDAEDPATLAAKRVFAIGDPLLLDRRAAALAQALAVPVGSLELALANWGKGERATLGFPSDASDDAALERARSALGL